MSENPAVPRRGEAPAGASRRAVWSWVLFDWAAQPYFTLITTFVFAPYFAAHVAASPAEGQALWGYAAAFAGLFIAVGSPVLGAVADASGRRKAWIGAFSVLLVAGSVPLWWVEPGVAYAVPLAMCAYVVATLGAEFATVFTNAMMPGLAPRARLGRLSGNGWAVGYVGGLASLLVVFALLAGQPGSGRTLLGLEPLFGLDPARHEADRAAGPLTALWYALFVIPLFVFVPDQPARTRLRTALRDGLDSLRRTIAGSRKRRDVFLFLIANMLYKDGFAALAAFGGIYGAGAFGWTAIHLGLFGIWLTVTGIVGALAGGWLDDRLGPKPIIMAAVATMTLALLIMLSVDRDSIFFVVDAAPGGQGMLAGTPERLFFAVGGLIGLAAGPMQSCSRTMLVHLSPPGDMTQYFGLFALSGKATSFAAPLLVAAVTAYTASQRIGIAMLTLFFFGAMAVLALVREER